MSIQYNGLPTTALKYWSVFTKTTVGMLMFITFTGAVGAFLVFAVAPEFLWLFVLGAASVAIHVSALFTRDVHRGRADMDQTEFASWQSMFALVIVFGFVESTVLLAGTGTAILIVEVTSLPIFAAMVAAAYYPVVDILLIRRGVWTPGGVMMGLTFIAVSTIMDFHDSLVQTIPIFGGNRRHQS
jgi:hypothetical protein